MRAYRDPPIASFEEEHVIHPSYILAVCATALVSLVLNGCSKDESTSNGATLSPPPQSGDGSAPVSPPGDSGAALPRGDRAGDDEPYAGPEFTIDILVMESFPEQYAALFKVTTNTGGWNLSLDRTAWEDGTLRAFLTLEGPGPDELVTQALEDHEARFAAGTKKIGKVEALVRITRRSEGGVQPYRLAATTGSN